MPGKEHDLTDLGPRQAVHIDLRRFGARCEVVRDQLVAVLGERYLSVLRRRGGRLDQTVSDRLDTVLIPRHQPAGCAPASLTGLGDV